MFPKDEVLLTIESIALSGEGIAKREGLVFFVDGALPGEEVRAEVVKVERNLVRAKALELFRTSPDRVKPVCKYFGSCGGCVFQHLSYEKQLEVKRRELEQMFKHLGGFDQISVEPVIPSPKPYHYRNTVAMSVRTQHGIPYLGFIERDNQTFLPIGECPIAEERINELLPHVKQRFQECVPEKKRYRTSQVVIRVGSEPSQFYTSIKGHQESSAVLTASVAGKTFRYSGSSFFQTNFSILESFVWTVRGFLDPSQKASLLDLYCGVGLFAICFSVDYGEVFGIEEGESATSFANENARANGAEHIKFWSGRTEELLRRTQEFASEKLHVLVDPPRVGMKKEAIEALLKMSSIERLVYVSCNPATLMRDLRVFSSRFRIEKVQPFDMFPQTRHLEIAVLLLPNP